jgi:hypothetical protein
MRSATVLGLCSLALGALAATALAGNPVLQSSSDILDGASPIVVSLGYSAPFVVDWNGDGKKDLLVGQKDLGKIRLYVNQGPDAAPSFSGFTYLKCAGSDISLPGG